MQIKDVDTVEQSVAAARRRLIANAPIEDRIAGLTPEELAAALPPEVLEILAQKAAKR